MWSAVAFVLPVVSSILVLLTLFPIGLGVKKKFLLAVAISCTLTGLVYFMEPVSPKEPARTAGIACIVIYFGFGAAYLMVALFAKRHVQAGR